MKRRSDWLHNLPLSVLPCGMICSSPPRPRQLPALSFRRRPGLIATATDSPPASPLPDIPHLPTLVSPPCSSWCASVTSCTFAAVVTTEMVLVEFLTYISAGGQQLRQRAAETVRSLKIDPNVEVVPQTSNQFEDALDLYASRPDQQWSLTDCASFVLMRQRYIWEALAEDHNFEQAKFAALLS